MLHLMLAPDEFLEPESRKEALDCEPTHRNQEARTDEAKLRFEPTRAVRTFRDRRNAITATCGTWPGITASYRRDIDPVARCRFVEPNALEPTKECLAGTTGKRAAATGLDFARRLSDKHCIGAARQRHDRQNVRSKPALPARRQRSAMISERALEFAQPNGHVNRYGGRHTPRSVTIADTSSAGVTSNAGL